MSELKPCPFCGSDDVTVLWMDNIVKQANCRICGAVIRRHDIDSAIDAWNTRVERTCHVVNEIDDDVFGVEIQLSCGHNVPMIRENFNYCPMCGAKVE